MFSELFDKCVDSIHQCDRRFVLATTGGGATAITALLERPGGSRTLLEAVTPYANEALENFLGGAPDQSCSEPTSRAMAMSAWTRARTLAPTDDIGRLVGIACTASLATDRPKRGEHRIFAAVQTLTCTHSYALVMSTKERSREDEERLAARMILIALAKRCGIDVKAAKAELDGALQPDETIVECGAVAEPAWSELIAGQRHWSASRPHTLEAEMGAEASEPQGLIFAGAFHPPHEGHLRMASLAEARTARPLAWEISVVNVDKPMLDFVSIHDRLQALRWSDERRLILLSTAPTFREKAKYFPNSIFVAGADTVDRIADPKYYQGDVELRDAAIDEIAAQGCRFLVFGRIVDGQFRTLSDLDLPPALTALCDEVPAAEFREDVSSTKLRASQSEVAL